MVKQVVNPSAPITSERVEITSFKVVNSIGVSTNDNVEQAVVLT